MNILIAADYRAPGSGNFVASLLELAERMRATGHGIYFLFPDNGKGGYAWSMWLEKNRFSVWLMNMDISDSEKVTFLRRVVSEHKIDLVHTHFGFCHRILLKYRKELPNIKILIHDHMDFSPEGSMQKQKVRTVAWSAIYQILGIGVISVMERKYKSYLLTSLKRRWFVPNGLSLRRNVDRELNREERRQQLGIDQGQKLCLFLGWDMYRKGVDIAVKAVARLRQQDAAVLLGLVGFGENPSEKSLQWIRERTGVEHECDWIRFFPSTEDMFSYHRAADVYLSASRKEAFSYGILEAISQNTPVVVSDIEGTQWAMQYSKAVSYPVEDADDCAAAIARVLEMRCMDSNYQEVMARYSIDEWCARIIDIYKNMLEK